MGDRDCENRVGLSSQEVLAPLPRPNFTSVQHASVIFQGSEAKEASVSRHRLDKGLAIFSPNLVTAVLCVSGQIQVGGGVEAFTVLGISLRKIMQKYEYTVKPWIVPRVPGARVSLASW